MFTCFSSLDDEQAGERRDQAQANARDRDAFGLAPFSARDLAPRREEALPYRTSTERCACQTGAETSRALDEHCVVLSENGEMSASPAAFDGNLANNF
jgi:hypothetical protein